VRSVTYSVYILHNNCFIYSRFVTGRQGSAAGIATTLRAGRFGFLMLVGARGSAPKAPLHALGPTQPRIECVLEFFSGGKVAGARC
jgi:hypothetical protein